MLSVIDEGKKLKESFEKRITGDSNAEYFSPIKKYPLKNFEYWSQKITVRKGDKEKQISAERDIFGLLMSTSYKIKAAVNLEPSLVYPLANQPPAICVPGGAPRKCAESKYYDADLRDLYLTGHKQLPGKETVHTYFLDVIALMRVLPRNNGTVRDIAWRILKNVPQQYSTMFLA